MNEIVPAPGGAPAAAVAHERIGAFLRERFARGVGA